MKYPYQPPVYGEYALAVVGNLGFAWSEAKGEVLIAILIEGSKYSSTYEGVLRNRREYQSRLRAKNRPRSAYPVRLRAPRGESAAPEVRRLAARAAQKAKQAQQKEWRAEDKVERDARRARTKAGAE